MRQYTFPPDAIYKAGKRKERTTKAINLVASLMTDNKNEDLETAILALKRYQKKLLEI